MPKKSLVGVLVFESGIKGQGNRKSSITVIDLEGRGGVVTRGGASIRGVEKGKEIG